MSQTARWRPNLRTVALTAFTIAFVAWMAKEVDTSSLVGWLEALPPGAVAVYLALYLVLGAVRALRFRSLILSSRPPFTSLFPIALVHNALSQVLFFRAGELSFPWLAHRHLQVPIGESLAALLVARLLDLTVVVLVGVSALALGTTAVSSTDVRPWLVLATAIGAPLAALRLGGPMAGWLARSLPGWRLVAPWRSTRPVAEVVRLLTDSSEHLGRVRSADRLARLAGFSLVIYLLSMACHLVVLEGVGAPGDLPVRVVAISAVVLAGALPISIGGLGVIEGSWALTFAALTEQSVPDGIALGLVLHGLQLVAVATSGLVGVVLLRWVGRPLPSIDENGPR